MTEVLTIHHCRSGGYCVTGIREHCKRLGLDFRRLVREGLPIAELEQIDDEIVQRCIRIARGEENG